MPRIRLAIELFQVDHLDQALAQAQQVKPAPEVSGADCYKLVRLYSRWHWQLKRTRVLQGSTGPSRRLSRRGCHPLALSAADERGLFNDPVEREKALKDPDLEILRDNPEFRRLLEPAKTKP